MICTVNEGILQLADAQSTGSVGVYCSEILPQLGVSSNGGEIPRARGVMVMMGMRLRTMDGIVRVIVVGHLS